MMKYFSFLNLKQFKINKKFLLKYIIIIEMEDQILLQRKNI